MLCDGRHRARSLRGLGPSLQRLFNAFGGAVVFGDASRRRALNKIMAGHIAKAMALQCLWHFAIGTAVIILDVPLLYETGVHRACTPARSPLLGICAAKTRAI